MPATASGMMKDGAPMLPNLREQIVSATSMTMPRTYSLRDGVSFTGFPCAVRNCANCCPHCFSQAAVRGALAGASRSSSASRVKSLSTSMS